MLPARKDRPISIEIPHIETVADSVKAAAAIAEAVALGELTPMEAADLSKVVEGYTRAATTLAADLQFIPRPRCIEYEIADPVQQQADRAIADAIGRLVEQW